MSAPSQSELPLAVVLRDGSRVTVREIRPEDAPLFSAAFAGLSSEARYNRFLGAVQKLAPSALERAVRPERRCAEGAAFGKRSRLQRPIQGAPPFVHLRVSMVGDEGAGEGWRCGCNPFSR